MMDDLALKWSNPK